MKKKIQDIIHFIQTGIWQVSRDDVSPLVYLLYRILKKLILTIRFFTTKRVMSQAAALTYSTLLAIVPIMAVVFAIARGFGYNKYIETVSYTHLKLPTKEVSCGSGWWRCH